MDDVDIDRMGTELKLDLDKFSIEAKRELHNLRKKMVPK
jgi:hypothetical protein